MDRKLQIIELSPNTSEDCFFPEFTSSTPVISKASNDVFVGVVRKIFYLV